MKNGKLAPSPDAFFVISLEVAFFFPFLDDSWQWHFVEADVQTNGSCHQQVVVLAIHCTITAVGAPHVCGKFVEASFVALHIQSFAHCLH